MIHICPRSLLAYVEASAGDEVIDLEDDAFCKPEFVGEIETAIARGQTTIWSAFRFDEIAPFTEAFMPKSQRLSTARWMGLILHSDVRFQIYGMISVMRLIASRGGQIGIKLVGDEPQALKSYYENLLASHGISMEHGLIDEHTGINVASSAASASLSRPIFEDRGNGVLHENDFARPQWNAWERQDVHGQTKANVCGLPFFLNPTTPIIFANLIEHFKPNTVVEVGAYKYGATAMLLLLTEWLGSKVIALNPPGLDDDPWFQCLKSKPWASRVSSVHWDDNLTAKLDGQWPVLAVFNWHYANLLSSMTAQIRKAYVKGVIVYHGDAHQETPGFISDIACTKGMKKIELVYEPTGGTWCSSGIFEFDNTKA